MVDAEALSPVKPGRKKDRSRDAVILDAALDVLAEVGYTKMTLATVAERVKAGKSTMYRRWPSKEDLVIDAVTRMKRDQVDLEHLPDTGDLRSDLLGLFKPGSRKEGEHKLRVMAGLSSMLADHPALADAAHNIIVEPWKEAIRLLLHRAVDRGDVPASDSIDVLARVIPETSAYRSLSRRRPFGEAFLAEMVDGVLLPRCATTAADRRERTTARGMPLSTSAALTKPAAMSPAGAGVYWHSYKSVLDRSGTR